MRLNQVKLLNHSFAPYQALEALLVFETEQITSSSDVQTWEELETDGVTSTMPIRCEAARRVDDNVEAGSVILISHRYSE